MRLILRKSRTHAHMQHALAILERTAPSRLWPTARRLSSPRTGEVKDIVIQDNVSPAIVTANPGDEIRWINKRQGDARVIFLLPVEGQLSCQRGFGGLMSANKNQYTAKLDSNETASVCFKFPLEIKYVVRADSNLPSGEINIPGAINIGQPGKRTSQTSE